MDENSTLVIIIILFTIIALTAIAGYKGWIDIGIKGPWNIGLNIKGQNASANEPAVKIEDVTSRKGGVTVEEKTGGGVSLQGADVDKDIVVRSEDTRPKA